VDLASLKKCRRRTLKDRWSEEGLQHNVQGIVNPARFLILPLGPRQRAGEYDLALSARCANTSVSRGFYDAKTC
jgi:hypothetical protein